MKSIIDQSELSNPWRGIYNPENDVVTRQAAIDAGYRVAPPIPAIETGFTRQIKLIEGDGINGQWEIVDTPVPTDAELLAAKLSTVTPELLQKAAIYRTALNRNFGIGSETDHTVTKAFVESYFAGRAAAGNMTVTEIGDKDLLLMTFPALSEWSGDGTAWEFFRLCGGMLQ